MNKNNPQISILLPTYNRPELLKDAIKSVLNQTYTNFEFIISNNCSSNQDVDKICREYAQKDSRIRYFCQKENIGCKLNTAFCINQMKNNYFFVMADDDIIAPEFIEKCVDKLQKTKGTVGCWSKIKYIDEDRNPIIDNKLESNADLTSNNPIDNIIKWTMLKHWMGGGVFDYSIIKDCDTHYKKVFGWDVLLTSQILLLGKIARVEEPLYTYQIRTKSEDIKQITESNQKDFNEFSVISSDLDIIMRTFELVFETDKLNVLQKIEFYFKMWSSILKNRNKSRVINALPLIKFIDKIEEKRRWHDYIYFLPYVIRTELKRLKFLILHPFLIFHKIKPNTILIINNNSSGKELLDYAQYFTNQGYNVDILSRMSHKKYLKNKKGIKVLKIKDNFSKFYETRMIKKYQFVVSVIKPENTSSFLNICNNIKYIEEFISEEQEVNV